MWSIKEWLISLQYKLWQGWGQESPFKWNAAIDTRSFGPFAEDANLMEWWDSFLKMELMVQLRADLWKNETHPLNQCYMVLCFPICVTHWSRSAGHKRSALTCWHSQWPSSEIYVSFPHKYWLQEYRVCSIWGRVLEGTSEISYPTESLLLSCGPPAYTWQRGRKKFPY